MSDWFHVAQQQYDRAVPAYLEDDEDERDPEDYEPDPDEERDRRFDDEDDGNWEE
jgi:hypothetical protein